jgi:hypothetical protein
VTGSRRLNALLDAGFGATRGRCQFGSPVLTGPSAGIVFARTGEPNPAPPANTFTLRLPDCTGDERRTLTVNAAGFVTIARSACP